MKLQSGFAILDVKRGRVALKKAVRKLPKKGGIKVIIHGHIDVIWGNDDGESQEFAVQVDKVEVPE
jgi:hypothetical protein